MRVVFRNSRGLVRRHSAHIRDVGRAASRFEPDSTSRCSFQHFGRRQSAPKARIGAMYGLMCAELSRSSPGQSCLVMCVCGRPRRTGSCPKSSMVPDIGQARLALVPPGMLCTLGRASAAPIASGLAGHHHL